MAAKGFDVVYTHERSRFSGGYEIISLLQKLQNDAIRRAKEKLPPTINGVGRHILGYYRATARNSPVADFHTAVNPNINCMFSASMLNIYKYKF